jgi:hypothetical protein
MESMEGQQLDGHSFSTPWGPRTIHATRVTPVDDTSTLRRICFRFVEEPSRHYTLEIANEFLVEDFDRVIGLLGTWLMGGPEKGATFRVDAAFKSTLRGGEPR